VAHACNPSYLEGRDQEDHSLSPIQTEKLTKPPFQSMTGHGDTYLLSQLHGEAQIGGS
jgi:hypothetical protein